MEIHESGPLLILAGIEPLLLIPTILVSEFVSGFSAGFFHAKAGNLSLRRGSVQVRSVVILSLCSLLGVFDGVRRQLDPEHQTGAVRIQEKLFSKPLVRKQSAEGPLHVPLTHRILLCVLCLHGRVRLEPEQGDVLS